MKQWKQKATLGEVIATRHTTLAKWAEELGITSYEQMTNVCASFDCEPASRADWEAACPPKKTFSVSVTLDSPEKVVDFVQNVSEELKKLSIMGVDEVVVEPVQQKKAKKRTDVPVVPAVEQSPEEPAKPSVEGE